MEIWRGLWRGVGKYGKTEKGGDGVFAARSNDVILEKTGEDGRSSVLANGNAGARVNLNPAIWEAIAATGRGYAMVWVEKLGGQRDCGY